MSVKDKASFKNMPKSTKIIVVAAIVFVAVAAVLSIYKAGKNHLLDRKEYKACVSQLSEAAEGFTSNHDLRDYITGWADENKLDYKLDDAGNIIFTHSADADKRNVAPVVICVSYNWMTAYENAQSLATAEMIAKSDLDSGKYTVIFFNDYLNLGNAYKKISSEYFSDDSKLVYLTSGSRSYISANSFSRASNSISIPCEMQPVICDTAVKIKIDGIPSEEIGPGIGSRPNALSALGTVLTKLSNKSITYQLSDVKLESNGNMCPSGIEATIILNSYSLGTLTSYLDEKIRTFTKNYKSDYPDISYSYEIIDNSADFPGEAYSDECAKKLNSVLYTIKNGAYRFDKQTATDGFEADEVYGINCIRDLSRENDSLVLSIESSGISKSYLNQILEDNSTVADLAGASYRKGSITPGLKNSKSRLYRELQFAYVKVNEISSSNVIIKEDRDYSFIPCGYLRSVNDKMDIVHLCEDSTNAPIYTNTLLCFIQDQGNFLSL